MDLPKTQKSKHLKNETLTFLQVKKNLYIDYIFYILYNLYIFYTLKVVITQETVFEQR